MYTRTDEAMLTLTSIGVDIGKDVFHLVGFDGDIHNGAGTARALGVPFVAVSFGYARTSVEDLEADVVIDHFDQLADALARLDAG